MRLRSGKKMSGRSTTTGAQPSGDSDSQPTVPTLSYKFDFEDMKYKTLGSCEHLFCKAALQRVCIQWQREVQLGSQSFQIILPEISGKERTLLVELHLRY